MVTGSITCCVDACAEWRSFKSERYRKTWELHGKLGARHLQAICQVLFCDAGILHCYSFYIHYDGCFRDMGGEVGLERRIEDHPVSGIIVGANGLLQTRRLTRLIVSIHVPSPPDAHKVRPYLADKVGLHRRHKVGPYAGEMGRPFETRMVGLHRRDMVGPYRRGAGGEGCWGRGCEWCQQLMNL